MPSAACIAESLKIQQSRTIKLLEIHIYQKTWKASTAYALNDRMKEGDHTYTCTQAGTSGTSKPTFNTTYGATTNDNIGGGTVIWTNDSLFYCDTEDTNITWNSKVYRRNQISIPTIGAQNIEGSFDNQTLTIPNIDQLLGEYIRTYDVRGNEVKIFEVYQALLADPADVKKTWRYQVSDAAYDDESGNLAIESMYSESRSEYPNSNRDRNVCNWDFDADGTDEVASDGCAFYTLYYSQGGATLDTTNYPSADATVCDKGLRTKNGCYAHFNQQNSLKPAARFRAYQGIPLVPIRSIQ